MMKEASALVIALTIGAPAWGQAPKSSVPAPWTLQQEQGSQLVPAAQPPFSPRLDATVAVPRPAQSAQPPLQTIDNITVEYFTPETAPRDDPNKINESSRKPREKQGAGDAAADLNRQELSRITGRGGYYRARGY